MQSLAHTPDGHLVFWPRRVARLARGVDRSVAARARVHERRHAELADAEDVVRPLLELIGREHLPRRLRCRPHLEAHQAARIVEDAFAVLVDRHADLARPLDREVPVAELRLDADARPPEARATHAVALEVVELARERRREVRPDQRLRGRHQQALGAHQIHREGREARRLAPEVVRDRHRDVLLAVELRARLPDRVGGLVTWVIRRRRVLAILVDRRAEALRLAHLDRAVREELVAGRHALKPERRPVDLVTEEVVERPRRRGRRGRRGGRQDGDERRGQGGRRARGLDRRRGQGRRFDLRRGRRGGLRRGRRWSLSRSRASRSPSEWAWRRPSRSA